MALSGSHSDQIFVPPKTMGIDITHHTESLKEKQCCVQKMRYVMSKTCYSNLNKKKPEVQVIVHALLFRFQLSRKLVDIRNKKSVLLSSCQFHLFGLREPQNNPSLLTMK